MTLTVHPLDGTLGGGGPEPKSAANVGCSAPHANGCENKRGSKARSQNGIVLTIPKIAGMTHNKQRVY